MNKSTLFLAALAITLSANARITVTREGHNSTMPVSLLSPTEASITPHSSIDAAGATQQMTSTPVLINTGVKIADVRSGKVSIEQLRQATARAAAAGNTPYSSATWAPNAAVIRETMDGFTVGSQSSPVAVSNSGMQIGAQYLQPSTDNLYGYGVYSLGDGLAALMGSSNEFRVIDIQAAQPLNIGFWVGALQSNAGVMLNMIEGDNGTSFLMTSQPTAVPYDGNIYWFETSSNGFTDKSNNPINAKVSLLIMGSNGSADTDLAFAGLWIDGQRYNGSTGGGGTGGGGGTTPDPVTPDIDLGIPSNVSHTIANDRQSFTVTYSPAANATHHEMYVFNDVTGPATANLLDVDWTPLNAGASDPQNPNLAYYAQNVKLVEIPGGLCHWHVVMDGALGFGYLQSVIDQTGSWAGFETSDYDLSPTQGVATINFEMYPTDWTVFILNEWALNRSTGKYDLVDSAELDGSEIQWNDWDQFNVTLDYLNPSQYDLEHVYFMFGLVSESSDTSIPSFLYFRQMHISMDVPSGKATYYLHADREVQGSQPITQKGDVDANNFNYTIRGNYYSGDGAAYGDWAADPNTGDTFYVRSNNEEPDPHGAGLTTLTTEHSSTYYDLHGQRVANPTPGIYIIRQGNKVTKRIVR